MDERLVGRWEKVTRSACAEPYPDELEVRANGIYEGRKEDAGGGFTTWDVGVFRPHGATVEISTANDAHIAYEFSLAEDVLTFVDPSGCRFEYRRAS